MSMTSAAAVKEYFYNQESMKEYVYREVENFISLFNSKSKKKVYMPEIRFDLKGKTGGTFEYNRVTGENFININKELLEKYQDEYSQTIGHEVAHYITYSVIGEEFTRNGRRQVHGKNWKAVMKMLGLDPKRCHNYDTSDLKKVKKVTYYSYTCDCGYDHQITKIRHNKILRGKQSYRCATCKTPIRKA